MKFTWRTLAVCLCIIYGCVTRVQVCTTYDRRLGRETPDRFAKDSAGASVCADIEPPARGE